MTRLLYHWHYAGIGLFVVVLDGIGVGARAHVLQSQHAGNHISGLDTDELCMGLVKFPTHTPHFFILWDTLKNFAKLNWFHHILTVSQQYPTQ